MPVVYKCKKCGYILYEFYRVGQDFYGLRTPTEIGYILAEKCPRCGHKFEVPTLEDITIGFIENRGRRNDSSYRKNVFHRKVDERQRS